MIAAADATLAGVTTGGNPVFLVNPPSSRNSVTTGQTNDKTVPPPTKLPTVTLVAACIVNTNTTGAKTLIKGLNREVAKGRAERLGMITFGYGPLYFKGRRCVDLANRTIANKDSDAVT